MQSSRSVSFGSMRWFFLEHVVSGNSIFIDLKKVEAIGNWERLKNVVITVSRHDLVDHKLKIE